MAETVGARAVRIDRPEEAPNVFQDAFNVGDLDGLVNLFESEAVVFLGPGQAAKGSAEIREMIASFLTVGGRLEIRLITHHRVGDIALNTVEHTLWKNGPDDSTNTVRLRAAVVFRTAGGWILAFNHRQRGSLRVINTNKRVSRIVAVAWYGLVCPRRRGRRRSVMLGPPLAVRPLLTGMHFGLTGSDISAVELQHQALRVKAGYRQPDGFDWSLAGVRTARRWYLGGLAGGVSRAQ